MAAASGLATARVRSDARRKRLGTVIRQHGLDTWREACRRVGASSFCRGESGNGTWRADLDFVLQAKSFGRILEGHYDDRPNARGSPPRQPQPKYDHFKAYAEELDGQYRSQGSDSRDWDDAQGVPILASTMSADSPKVYLFAVEDFSLDAIKRACRLFVRGEVKGRNNAFAPSAPELADACKMAEGQLKVEHYEAERVFVEAGSQLWKQLQIHRGDHSMPTFQRDGKDGWFLCREDPQTGMIALHPISEQQTRHQSQGPHCAVTHIQQRGRRQARHGREDVA